MKLSLYLPKSHIAKRVIIFTVLVSSLITLVITSIQLYRDYHSDVEQIDSRFHLIQQIHLKTISESLWTLDEYELKIHLEGIIRMRDIIYMSVSDQGKVVVHAGKIIGTNTITKIYPITHIHQGKSTQIGTLKVVASLDKVFARLIDKVWVILVSNAIKTFLVAGFILFFFQAHVTRYITQLSDYVARLRPNNLADRFAFKDRHKKPLTPDDELDVLAQGINEMQSQLHQAFEALKNHKTNLEATVRNRTRELERINAELESFSYSVSHDLRAPLRAIEGFSRILEEEHVENLSDQAKHYINRICANVYKMSELIDELLTLSRVSQKVLERDDFDLTELSERVLNSLSSHYPNKSVKLVIAEPLKLNADEKLIEIAMTNLFDNAIKYSGKEKPVVITVGQQAQDDQQTYYVRDNGHGFDERFRDKLFLPFHRLNRDNSIPGNGVGLATVHRIIERHGGKIWAQSTLDQGSTFYFTIAKPA